MMGASLDGRQRLLWLSFYILLQTEYYNSCFGANLELGKKTGCHNSGLAVFFVFEEGNLNLYTLFMYVFGTCALICTKETTGF